MKCCRGFYVAWPSLLACLLLLLLLVSAPDLCPVTPEAFVGSPDQILLHPHFQTLLIPARGTLGAGAEQRATLLIWKKIRRFWALSHQTDGFNGKWCYHLVHATHYYDDSKVELFCQTSLLTWTESRTRSISMYMYMSRKLVNIIFFSYQ